MPAANHAEVVEAEKWPGRLLAIRRDYLENGDENHGMPHLRVAVEQSRQAALLLSDTGHIVAANQKASDIFGYATGELVGRALGDLVPALSGDKVALWSMSSAPAAPAFEEHPEHVFTGARSDGVAIPLQLSCSTATAGPSQFVLLAISEVASLDLKARLTAASNAHLGFQRLIADVASNLGRTEAAALDGLMAESLRRIGEALQFDRAILWRKNGGESFATPAHYWAETPSWSPPPQLPVASIPFVISRLQAGEAAWFSRVDELPDPIDRETFRRLGPRSGAVVPVPAQGDEPGALWALAFSCATPEYAWVPSVLERLQLVAGVLGLALMHRRTEAALASALNELERLRGRLVEPAEIRRDMRTTRTPRLIVSESPSAKRALAQVQQVAPTTATVLLRGETGTGKEVFAQAIHDLSPRHQRPMVVVSCAAIPTALIESELFGRERGAFTGALSRQIGRFEAANQSTLFLDEIGELPMEMQVKLLRVLQDRTIERLGSTQPIKVDVRIIAATNRDLEAAVHDGTFREDLYYRLDVFPVEVPPLRERAEDIPGLLWSFVDEFSRAFGKTIDSIPNANMKELQHYTWPGNIRELRNAVERAVILSTGRQLVVPVPTHAMRVARTTAAPSTAMTLEALEIEHIRAVLAITNWRVRGPGGAAERLGLKPTTLDSRMARLGISRSTGGSDSKRPTIRPRQKAPSGHDMS